MNSYSKYLIVCPEKLWHIHPNNIIAKCVSIIYYNTLLDNAITNCKSAVPGCNLLEESGGHICQYTVETEVISVYYDHQITTPGLIIDSTAQWSKSQFYEGIS